MSSAAAGTFTADSHAMRRILCADHVLLLPLQLHLTHADGGKSMYVSWTTGNARCDMHLQAR